MSKWCSIRKDYLLEAIRRDYLAANPPHNGSNIEEWIDSELLFLYLLQTCEDFSWWVEDALGHAIRRLRELIPYNREALKFLTRRYSRDYPEVNAVVDLCHNGFRLIEMPVSMRDRQGGRSHITLWRAVYYMCKVPLASLMTALRRRERGS